MSKFVYSLAGYRKYVDTEFLNELPFEKLSQMLWGIIICDDDCFYNLEEGLYSLIDWEQFFKTALNTDWKTELKQKEINEKKEKIKGLEQQINKLKGELNEE